jgi:histidine phosphotransferase ChpT
MADAPELASRLAARLCHDFMGPTGAILSGLELLDDASSPVPREEALSLVRDSARALTAQLTFARAAFGAADGEVGGEELESLARGLFEATRSTLDWDVPPRVLPGATARILLNLVQIAAAGAAAGGVVRASLRTWGDGGTRLVIEALGEKARLYPDVLAGLNGEARQGMAGRWVQGAFVHAIVAAAGGRVEAVSGSQGVTFTATIQGPIAVHHAAGG